MSFDVIAKSGLSHDRLQTLVLLAESGSIAAAAARDPTRQSQYSRQLAELERCFGCKLTERRGRSLALTPEGIRLAQLAREHLQALEHFAMDAAGRHRTIRIGAGESMINWLLIPHEPRDEACSWHYFNLQADAIIERLLDQRLDFGLVRDIDDGSRLQTGKLGHLETSLFVPSGLLKDTLQHTPANVAAMVPLALLDGTSPVRSAIEKACVKQKRRPQITHECTTASQIAALVAAGRAAGPLPTIARHMFTNLGVEEFPMTKLLGQQQPLHLAWNRRALATDTRLEGIRDALLARLSKGLTQIGTG